MQSLTGLFREHGRAVVVLRKQLYIGLRFDRGGNSTRFWEQGWVCQHFEDQQPYHPACELLHARCLVSISWDCAPISRGRH